MNKKIFKCPYCPELSFSTLNSLGYHLAKVHGLIFYHPRQKIYEKMGYGVILKKSPHYDEETHRVLVEQSNLNLLRSTGEDLQKMTKRERNSLRREGFTRYAKTQGRKLVFTEKGLSILKKLEKET